ncbi:MAG: hypothetical protein WDW36_001882 [Sanguina aurantia]
MVQCRGQRKLRQGWEVPAAAAETVSVEGLKPTSRSSVFRKVVAITQNDDAWVQYQVVDPVMEKVTGMGAWDRLSSPNMHKRLARNAQRDKELRQHDQVQARYMEQVRQRDRRVDSLVEEQHEKRARFQQLHAASQQSKIQKGRPSMAVQRLPAKRQIQAHGVGDGLMWRGLLTNTSSSMQESIDLRDATAVAAAAAAREEAEAAEVAAVAATQMRGRSSMYFETQQQSNFTPVQFLQRAAGRRSVFTHVQSRYAGQPGVDASPEEEGGEGDGGVTGQGANGTHSAGEEEEQSELTHGDGGRRGGPQRRYPSRYVMDAHPTTQAEMNDYYAQHASNPKPREQGGRGRRKVSYEGQAGHDQQQQQQQEDEGVDSHRPLRGRQSMARQSLYMGSFTPVLGGDSSSGSQRGRGAAKSVYGGQGGRASGNWNMEERFSGYAAGHTGASGSGRQSDSNQLDRTASGGAVMRESEVLRTREGTSSERGHSPKVMQLRALQNARRSSAALSTRPQMYLASRDTPEWQRREAGGDAGNPQTQQRRKGAPQPTWRQQLHRKQQQQQSNPEPQQQEPDSSTQGQRGQEFEMSEQQQRNGYQLWQHQQGQQQGKQQQQQQQEEHWQQQHQQEVDSSVPTAGTESPEPVNFLSKFLTQLQQHPQPEEEEDCSRAPTRDPSSAPELPPFARPGAASQAPQDPPGQGVFGQILDGQNRGEATLASSRNAARPNQHSSGTDNDDSSQQQTQGSAGASSDTEPFISPDPWTLHSSGEDEAEREAPAAADDSHTIWQIPGPASPDRVGSLSLMLHIPAPVSRFNHSSSPSWRTQQQPSAANQSSSDLFSFDMMSRQQALAHELTHGSTTPNMSTLPPYQPPADAASAAAVPSLGKLGPQARQPSAPSAPKCRLDPAPGTSQSVVHHSSEMSAVSCQSFMGSKPLSPPHSKQDLRSLPVLLPDLFRPSNSPGSPTFLTAPANNAPAGPPQIYISVPTAREHPHGSPNSPTSRGPAIAAHTTPGSTTLHTTPGSPPAVTRPADSAAPRVTHGSAPPVQHPTSGHAPPPAMAGHPPSLAPPSHPHTAQSTCAAAAAAGGGGQYLPGLPMTHVPAHPSQYRLADAASSLDALAHKILSPRTQSFRNAAQRSIHHAASATAHREHMLTPNRPQSTGQFHPSGSLHAPSHVGRKLNISADDLSLMVARVNQAPPVDRAGTKLGGLPALGRGERPGVRARAPEGQRSRVHEPHPGTGAGAALCAVQMPALGRGVAFVQAVAAVKAPVGGGGTGGGMGGSMPASGAGGGGVACWWLVRWRLTCAAGSGLDDEDGASG